MLRLVLALGVVIPLAACGTPTPLSIASLVLDVGSYAVTGKTTTDHAFSAVAGQDCAVIRMLEGDPCSSYDDYELALAVLEPLPEEGDGVVRIASTFDLRQNQVAAFAVEDVVSLGPFAHAIFLSDDGAPGLQTAGLKVGDPEAAGSQAHLSEPTGITQLGATGFLSDDHRPDRGLPVTQRADEALVSVEG